jgi:hypothetical protein
MHRALLLLLLGAPMEPVAAQLPVGEDTLPGVIIDGMVSAYNCHDVPALLHYFADSFTASVLTRDSTIVVLTPAILGPRLDSLFIREPGRRLELLSRTVHGAFVVDHSRKVGTTADGPDLLIYEVRGGLIRRIWTTP